MTIVQLSDFNEAMRQPPEPRLSMPPAEGGPSNSAQAWLDAISGKGPQFMGLIDSRKAAADWQAIVDSTPRSFEVK